MLRIRREKDRARKRTKKKTTEEGKKRSSETEDHEKQRLATLKRGDDNELERNLRLEKEVTSKLLRLAMEAEDTSLKSFQSNINEPS